MGWFRSSRSSTEDVERTPTFEERLAAIQPGVPGRCPACDGLGYIDDLDLGHRFQIQHCKGCGHRWEYLFDAAGHVVGLTELDDQGRPVARMRVRDRQLLAEDHPAPPAPVLPPVTDVALDLEGSVIDLRPAPEPDRDAGDEVIDLRPAAEATAEAAAELMSPAEWLRHSLRR